MALTIPKEQKHGVDIPAMMAFYQYVKLTPMGSKSDHEIYETSYSDEIKWELSGENIINLAKSYIQFDLEFETKGVSADAFIKIGDGSKVAPTAGELYPHFVKGMKKGFGIASFRLCNQTGTDLVKLDDSYEPYRVFMDELVRKRADIFYQTNFYDGIELKWDDKIHENVMSDVNEWEMDKDEDKASIMPTGGTKDTDEFFKYKNTKTIHVKLQLGKLYNTFCALKSDVFFAERMFICLRFQTNPNFGPVVAYKNDKTTNFTGNITNAPVTTKLKNFFFYAYINKDTDCNNNTKSYCLSKPIQFNDVKCHQIVVNQNTTGLFNYSFTLNSSNGPFLRYIIYRPWIEKEKRYAVIPENAQFRWLINDFVYQPDFSLMQYYDSYMTVQDYFKDSWYDIFGRNRTFNEKFFEILNFGSKDLDNIKNQSGRPLATDLKITFEFSAPGNIGKNDFVDHEITHRFYIVTGRMCTINGSGIVSVI